MAKESTFEVWVHKADDTWHQILDTDDVPVFLNEKRALAIMGKIACREDTVETVMFERMVRSRLNGPALVDRPEPSPRSPIIKSGEGD